MKKGKKIVFTLVVIIALAGIVLAESYKIDKSETLSNVVNGNSTSRNKVEGSATFGSDVTTRMYDVKNVTGINAEDGIRVKTIVKKTNLGVTTNKQEVYVPVYPTTTTASIGALFTYNTKTNQLKITWEDWTGNTSFYARFTARDGR